jgi:hypothetical protein
MVCRCCQSADALRREPRSGFLQKSVFPLLGLYPWECVICRKVRLYRAYSKHQFQQKQASESTSATGSIAHPRAARL